MDNGFVNSTKQGLNFFLNLTAYVGTPGKKNVRVLGPAVKYKI
jgi:hypothetical protein